MLMWLCQRRQRWGETGEAVPDEQRDSEERSRVLTQDIQVVVAIAMPCRPRRISSSLSPEAQRDQDVLNYSIGVHTTPLKDGV